MKKRRRVRPAVLLPPACKGRSLALGRSAGRCPAYSRTGFDQAGNFRDSPDLGTARPGRPRRHPGRVRSPLFPPGRGPNAPRMRLHFRPGGVVILQIHQANQDSTMGKQSGPADSQGVRPSDESQKGQSHPAWRGKGVFAGHADRLRGNLPASTAGQSDAGKHPPRT